VNSRFTFVCAGAVALSSMLAACGGGGGAGGGSSGDVVVGAPTPTPTITGPNKFLQFPNPQVLSDGSLETDSTAYAEAYYAAVDPTNSKDTLAKWKAANGFGNVAGELGEVTAVFGDVRDLGYGRRMTARQNPDGTIAMTVENYLVTAGSGYEYSSLNLDAAVAQDPRWHVGVNGIEFSPGPNGTFKFAKFYTFNPVTGERLLAANLDGRGLKAMPGICISCHGGRGDPLTPVNPSTGKPLFPLVRNSISQQRGDTQARLQMFDVDSFGFSSERGFTRPELEGTLKTLNKMVLCTYPLATPSSAPEDACRPAAGPNEWQGSADAVIKAAYGGDGLPNATFSDSYVPTGWVTAGQSSLYRNVLQPACMTCHRLRGTNNQSDLSFNTYAAFSSYSDRIKVHVYDRGNMPLAKIVSEKFWATTMAETLASWLESLGLGFVLHDSNQALLKPGRPVADPGPGRVVNFGPTTLSGSGSQFATTYSWSITTNPGGAGSLANADTAAPAFTATADGTYVVQLVVGNGSTQSTPVSQTIVVKNVLSPAPSAIRFADIKNVLQTAGCTACHTAAGTGSGKPPIFYTDIDRNEDGVVDATDTAWFYKELRGRINFTDVGASPLLRKPSNNHHFGGLLPGFNASLPPGDPGRASYGMFLNWILNGAPQ